MNLSHIEAIRRPLKYDTPAVSYDKVMIGVNTPIRLAYIWAQLIGALRMARLHVG